MKRVLIVGAGKSGKAAEKLLNGKAETFLWDDNMSELEKPNVKDFDEVLLSPGVSLKHPMAVTASELNIKITGELETAFENCEADFVAITGSNGKTTTTTLVGEIFKSYFNDVRVVGNIGLPVSEEVMTANKDTIMVAEVSSFQLETVSSFKPHVSAILNLTPDHLDRHGSFENYVAAKANIFKNQTSEDFFVYNADDSKCRELAEALNGPKLIAFSSSKNLPYEIKDIQIPGVHNMQNALAAAAIASCYGIPKEIVLKTIAEFKGVEHRMEFVRELDGVRYINDSKGTNPDSTIKAIAATNPGILLIAGGYEKNSDFTELINSFDGKVKYILTLGFTGPRFGEKAVELGFDPKNIIACKTMEDCVEAGHRLAKSGDTVLLSPASASWDMYGHFEERGDHFKRLVNEL